MVQSIERPSLESFTCQASVAAQPLLASMFGLLVVILSWGFLRLTNFFGFNVYIAAIQHTSERSTSSTPCQTSSNYTTFALLRCSGTCRLPRR